METETPYSIAKRLKAAGLNDAHIADTLVKSGFAAEDAHQVVVGLLGGSLPSGWVEDARPAPRMAYWPEPLPAQASMPETTAPRATRSAPAVAEPDELFPTLYDEDTAQAGGGVGLALVLGALPGVGIALGGALGLLQFSFIQDRAFTVFGGLGLAIAGAFMAASKHSGRIRDI